MDVFSFSHMNLDIVHLTKLRNPGVNVSFNLNIIIFFLFIPVP